MTTRSSWTCLALFAAVSSCTPKEKRIEPLPQDVAQPAPARSTEVVVPTMRDCPPSLLAARRGGADADRYVVPTDAERDAMVEVAAALVAGGAAGRATAAATAAAAGFEIVAVPELADVVLVRESESRRRGGGAYMFRLGAPGGVVVQAPHTFFDEGTLPLACELFARASARALFIDTAHRYKAAGADEKGELPADVAHAARSIYQSMTEGLLRAQPRGTLVQVHGFAKRDSGASIVISSGARAPGDPLVARAASSLTAVVGAGVQRFPEDTRELGATTNVQGVAARAAGSRFLHVEIEAGLRRKLLGDESLRARFIDALATSVAEP